MNSRVSYQTVATTVLACFDACWASDGRAAAKPTRRRTCSPTPALKTAATSGNWTIAGKTTATFRVDDKDAAAGHHNAVLNVGTVEWGVQFGQTIERRPRARPTPSPC